MLRGGKRTGGRCGHPLGAEFEPHDKGEAQILPSPLDELCPSRNCPDAARHAAGRRRIGELPEETGVRESGSPNGWEFEHQMGFEHPVRLAPRRRGTQAGGVSQNPRQQRSRASARRLRTGLTAGSGIAVPLWYPLPGSGAEGQYGLEAGNPAARVGAPRSPGVTASSDTC